MKNLILVKLGGSLITNKKKPFTAKPRVIRKVAREIHKFRKRNKTLLILGHGGGSYPHVPALRYETAKGVINDKSMKGISEVQNAAATLNRIVVNEFIKEEENVVSLNPSSFMIARDGRVSKAYIEPLEDFLDLGMLPIVYGDVVLDTKKGCCILSTEKILSYFALSFKKRYKITRMIYCGITNGVYDQEGNTIPKITPQNFKKLKRQLGQSGGIDVTGGMLHKVEEGLKLVTILDLKIVVVNGLIPGQLKKVLEGKEVKGTLITK